MTRDILLYNGLFHTLDPQRPVASALWARDGRIVATGSDVEVRALAGAISGEQAVDLGGHAVLPGLIDAHLHFEWYSLGLLNVDAETATLAECLERVRAKAAATPPGQWVSGLGWNQNAWGGQFPTAAQLDTVAPEHPVMLRAKSGHAAWANSFALRLAGVTA